MQNNHLLIKQEPTTKNHLLAKLGIWDRRNLEYGKTESDDERKKELNEIKSMVKGKTYFELVI